MDRPHGSAFLWIFCIPQLPFALRPAAQVGAYGMHWGILLSFMGIIFPFYETTNLAENKRVNPTKMRIEIIEIDQAHPDIFPHSGRLSRPPGGKEARVKASRLLRIPWTPSIQYIWRWWHVLTPLAWTKWHFFAAAFGWTKCRVSPILITGQSVCVCVRRLENMSSHTKPRVMGWKPTLHRNWQAPQSRHFPTDYLQWRLFLLL